MRSECQSCVLNHRPPTQKAALLCGSCSLRSRPRSFCVVEMKDHGYLWTLLRTDSLPEAKRSLVQLQTGEERARFAVVRWVADRGYIPAFA